MLGVMNSVFVLTAIMGNQDDGDRDVSGDLPSHGNSGAIPVAVSPCVRKLRAMNSG